MDDFILNILDTSGRQEKQCKVICCPTPSHFEQNASSRKKSNSITLSYATIHTAVKDELVIQKKKKETSVGRKSLPEKNSLQFGIHNKMTDTPMLHTMMR